MFEWPEDLVADIARRRSVLFLGAGVSRNSRNDKGERPKEWREFLESAASKISETKRSDVQKCIEGGDLLTACDLIKNHLRSDGFKSLLLSEFSDRGFHPAKIHDFIVKIDSRLVMTTNFDKIYENRANHIQRNTVIVKNYYDDDVADVLRRSQRSVLKVHGTIDSADRMVFTRRDYAKARINYANFYRLFESLLVTNTFVFLGASMRDPDIQLLLENHAYQFTGSRPHYMVMPRDSAPPAVLEILYESMNLRALLYDPKDDHAELSIALEELAAQVLSARTDLVETLDW